MGSPLLTLPGAVEAAGHDAGVAAHYGNPLIEQRRLATGEAIVDLSHHSVLTITGPDRLSWLHSISSQSLTGMRAGDSSETLLLAPTGRLEHAVRLLEDGETLWLLVERAEAPDLLDWLTKMRFMLRVELADRTDDFATVGSLSSEPLVAPAISNATALVWHDPWTSVAPGGHQYALRGEHGGEHAGERAGRHPGEGWSWSETLVPRGELQAIVGRVASGDLRIAGLLALEALRIAAWRPRFATEVDERTIPHELDWLRTAVHLEKGCYRGQETVAKVHNLGHPPRRLVMLHLDGSDAVLPPVGSPVWFEMDGERREAGLITSSAIHYELGPIALAVVKRGTDVSLTVNVDAEGIVVTAAQEVVVPPTAGAEAHVPRLPRLGAVTRPRR